MCVFGYACYSVVDEVMRFSCVYELYVSNRTAEHCIYVSKEDM